MYLPLNNKALSVFKSWIQETIQRGCLCGYISIKLYLKLYMDKQAYCSDITLLVVL